MNPTPTLPTRGEGESPILARKGGGREGATISSPLQSRQSHEKLSHFVHLVGVD